MRIPSGKTDQNIFFVAVDATDLKTRETGLTGFTVYRSRNGGAATVYTTPTVTELSAANMPGVYALLLDEDTTIAAGSDSEEYVVHITQASMAPVTRAIELYRRDTTSGRTLDVSAGGEAGLDWANIGGAATAQNLSGTTVASLTNAPSDSAGVTTLLGRLTAARAGYLDVLNGIVASIWAAVVDSAGVTTLLTRLTGARAGYLDNLNIGGAVASSAEITAINQSASRRILLAVVAQMERPESGSTTFTVEMRTFDGDGAAVNADSTPTITPIGITSGNLSANLGAVSNPATGVYRATYTVASGATVEQIRFDGSATIGGSTFTISAYSQVVDFVAVTFTATDRSNIEAILTDTNELQTDWVNGGRLDNILDARSSQASVDTLTGYVDTEVAAIKAKTDNLPIDPADASDVAASFAVVNAKLDAIDDFVDTEVGAIKAKTDNLPSDPADASDIAAAFSLLNDVSPAEVETAVTNALTAYDPPTRTEATGDKNEIIAQVDANEVKIDAIKAKTDSLAFTKPGEVDSNIQSVNNVTVTGTGATGDEWGP